MSKLIVTLLKLLLVFVAVALGTAGKDADHHDQQADDRSNYDVTFYWLDLHISDSSTYVTGNVSIDLKATGQPLEQVVLDLADLLHADSVLVDQHIAGFIHENNELKVRLPEQVLPDSGTTIRVFYHGLGKNITGISGIYNRYNSTWAKNVTWTLSEPFNALNWFPCKQILTDKADSVYVFLSTDKKLKAGSNGLLTAQVLLPDDRIRYEWKSRYPIAYYLISFAVSEYYDYSFYVNLNNSQDSVLIQNYIYDESYLTQNKSGIDKTGDLMVFYSDLFGTYPFRDEKYGHCLAPLGGGMEHQTMTTLTNFSFVLVAHELAHQWFGDYVTCGNWQDIWVNEGFASYSEYLAYQYLIGQDEARSWLTRVHDYIKSAPGGSIYIPEADKDDDDRIFNYRLTYNKGAAMIHMIRREVNQDPLFFEILREFLDRYRNNNATGADFKNLLEERTGLDFDVFFDQWYYGEGYPIHTITWKHQHDTLYITSMQHVSSSTPLFNMPIDFRVTSDDKDTVISLRQSTNFDHWEVFMPGHVSSIGVDPEQWLLVEVAGINNLDITRQDADFTLVPNPARDRVTLRFSNPVESYLVHLSDSSGKILLSEKSQSQQKVIDIRSYPSGIYFIIVEIGNAHYPARFVKN
ncbi:MAG TPA: M1 family aminopeptidase [Bacteroidales bacterium]|nr:M1 family aminopeptidase [Bacteroidales bacterium]